MASDEEKKDGRFSFEEIHQYLLQGVYPSTFSKSDKQALRKRAKFFAVKGADLYYTRRGENRNHVVQSQACNIRLLLFCAYNK